MGDPVGKESSRSHEVAASLETTWTSFQACRFPFLCLKQK